MAPKGLGVRVQAPGSRVQAPGFRIQDSGFRGLARPNTLMIVVMAYIVMAYI